MSKVINECPINWFQLDLSPWNPFSMETASMVLRALAQESQDCSTNTPCGLEKQIIFYWYRAQEFLFPFAIPRTGFYLRIMLNFPPHQSTIRRFLHSKLCPCHLSHAFWFHFSLLAYVLLCSYFSEELALDSRSLLLRDCFLSTSSWSSFCRQVVLWDRLWSSFIFFSALSQRKLG